MKEDKRDYFLDKILEIEKRVNSLEVEIKSFLKNITLIKWFVSIILVLLAFFGYREVSGIRKSIINSVNPKVRYIDSLINTIKTSKLDSLSNLIRERQKEQEKLLDKINELLSTTKEIEEKYIKIIPENPPFTKKTKSRGWIPISAHNLFDIIKPEKNFFKEGKKKRVVILKLNIPVDSVYYISIKVYKKNIYLIGEFNYKPLQKYNKLPLEMNLTSDMFLNIGIFLIKDKNEIYPKFYLRKISVFK